MILRAAIFSLFALFLAFCGASTAVAGNAPEEVRFNRDIRPILSDTCFQCHGPDAGTRQADLRLDLQTGLFGKSSSDEPLISPGDSAKSELFRRITSDDPDLRMPPADHRKQLSPEQIELIRHWVDAGAQWEGHWAYQPIRREPVPSTQNTQWPVNDVDRFILAKLEARSISPSPAADPVTLIRRLRFDLTGLPPTQSEVAAFQANHDDASYLQLVDQLLASPQFGERMAMYWLDLVRYGDSGGYHSDNEHHISPYRDYVIAAFNENMRFDQFTREQLAGDLLPNPTRSQIIATGYNRLNKTTEEGGAQAGEYLEKYAADRIRTTSGAWLGITLGCAECHDHKYDPFTTQDFYSFGAFFADVKEVGVYGGQGKREPEMPLPTPAQSQELAELDQQIAAVQGKLEAASVTAEDKAAIEKELGELKKKRDAFQGTFARTLVTVAVEPREMRILPRGNWLDRSGTVVASAVPASLPQPTSKGTRLTRLDLANWMVDRSNPLTARVFVNRLWKMFFGAGLSRRLDDFGVQGEWPTDPELLDWLASEFVDSGWDVKHMVRLLVTSNAYQQTSIASDELMRVDPQNRLFARQSQWRMEAEMIRDNSLAVSGLLVPEIGGPSVKPYQPAGYWSYMNFPKRDWKSDEGPNQYRRGLYTHWQRTFLHPSLLAFDAPSREECTAERSVSNTPKQALTLLNDPTYVECARVFAAKILLAPVQAQGLQPLGFDDRARIQFAWREALAREADANELEIVENVLNANREHYRANADAAEKIFTVGQAPVDPQFDRVELAAWTAVARTILNLNESITRN